MYSIEPDPVTFAFSVSLVAITAPPLPEMSMVARLLLMSSPRTTNVPRLYVVRARTRMLRSALQLIQKTERFDRV